jgi:hypothetical protein
MFFQYFVHVWGVFKNPVLLRIDIFGNFEILTAFQGNFLGGPKDSNTKSSNLPLPSFQVPSTLKPHQQKPNAKLTFKKTFR